MVAAFAERHRFDGQFQARHFAERAVALRHTLVAALAGQIDLYEEAEAGEQGVAHGTACTLALSPPTRTRRNTRNSAGTAGATPTSMIARPLSRSDCVIVLRSQRTKYDCAAVA